MERLVRLVAALHQRGDRGVPATNLAEIAGFDGEDAISQLTREFRYLRDLGWQIENIGGEGNAGIYRMLTVDNRIAVRLTAEQQAALRRAVLLANRDDLVTRLGLPVSERPAEYIAAVPMAGDDALDIVTEALRSRWLLTFRYSGTDRVVHPESVRNENGKWYLRAHEDGTETIKYFVVSRMSSVAIDSGRPAVRLDVERHPGLHPMSWEMDAPVDVTVRAEVDHERDVLRWLGTPSMRTEVGEDVDLVYRVTNRAALRARIYELGPRVQVLGPEEIRAEILGELAEMAGE